MINCALITDDESFRRQVRGLMQDAETSVRLVLELSESASALSRDRVADILAADPDVVFVDLGDSIMGIRVLEVLSQEAPEVLVIAAGPSVPAESLLRVIRAGATEYLPRPFLAEDTEQAFRRVRRRLGISRSDESASRGQIVTVFSPKGGTGVTTLAVNLAVSIHEMTRESTIVLDLATELGTAALTLGLQPRYSYLDVIQNFHRMDEELFQSFLEIHDSGVRVLASPPRSEDPTGPSMDEVMGLIRFCRRHFARVIVDAGNVLTDAAEVALMEADHRLWVATPEIPTLRNLKRTLERVGDHPSDGKGAPRVVLNQYTEGLGVTPQEVTGGLGLDVEAVIGREVTLVSESINLGRPVVSLGKSAYARSIAGIAEKVVGPIDAPLRRGFLQTLLRPFRSNGTGAVTKEVV